jgi:hypothetical protein
MLFSFLKRALPVGLILISVSVASAQPAPNSTPAPAQSAPPAAVVAPTQGSSSAVVTEASLVDSKWRLVGLIGAGALAPHGEGAANTLETDFGSGVSASLGILANYRPRFSWGMDFGIKIISMSREAKNSDLDLRLSYLALPFEFRFTAFRIKERSSFFIKAGLTYLILLTASVDEDSSWLGSDGDDDDDWDLFPTPPTEGSYRASFNKTDWLASLGVGTDLLLYQAANGFNVSLVPEIIYYQGLTKINKPGEFGGDVRNQGFMINVPVAFGF